MYKNRHIQKNKENCREAHATNTNFLEDYTVQIPKFYINSTLIIIFKIRKIDRIEGQKKRLETQGGFSLPSVIHTIHFGISFINVCHRKLALLRLRPAGSFLSEKRLSVPNPSANLIAL